MGKLWLRYSAPASSCQRVALLGKSFSVQASTTLGRTRYTTESSPGGPAIGMLYLTREAASSFLKVCLSWGSTSVAVPSRITTSSPESRWIEIAGLRARLRDLRESRPVPKYRAPSIQKPYTGME